MGSQHFEKVDKIYDTNGPAAKAGIRSGDIIKSINKKSIKDIYEYMKRMEEIKPGQSIPFDIKRDGKIIIPNSNTNFRENDDVVFFAETQYINKLEKLLSTY